jgi:hypothetical protein
VCWALNHQNLIEMAQGHISLSGVEVVGGIYSPQPPIQQLGKAVVDGRTGQSGAPATSPNR